MKFNIVPKARVYSCTVSDLVTLIIFTKKIDEEENFYVPTLITEQQKLS